MTWRMTLVSMQTDIQVGQAYALTIPNLYLVSLQAFSNFGKHGMTWPTRVQGQV
jgi:hypothetical protein